MNKNTLKLYTHEKEYPAAFFCAVDSCLHP